MLFEVFFRDATVEDIAQRMEVPVGTVRSRTFYALRALAAAEHARIAARPEMDPRLNEPSFWSYFARVVAGRAARRSAAL